MRIQDLHKGGGDKRDFADITSGVAVAAKMWATKLGVIGVGPRPSRSAPGSTCRINLSSTISSLYCAQNNLKVYLSKFQLKGNLQCLKLRIPQWARSLPVSSGFFSVDLYFVTVLCKDRRTMRCDLHSLLIRFAQS